MLTITKITKTATLSCFILTSVGHAEMVKCTAKKNAYTTIYFDSSDKKQSEECANKPVPVLKASKELKKSQDRKVIIDKEEIKIVKPKPVFSTNRTVAINGISYSLRRTDEIKTVVNMAQQYGAEEKYLQLITSDILSTKLYGLIGLKLIHSDKYAEAARQLAKIKGEVKYSGGGCGFYEVPFRKGVYLVAEMDLSELTTIVQSGKPMWVQSR